MTVAGCALMPTGVALLLSVLAGVVVCWRSCQNLSRLLLWRGEPYLAVCIDSPKQ